MPLRARFCRCALQGVGVGPALIVGDVAPPIPWHRRRPDAFDVRPDWDFVPEPNAKQAIADAFAPIIRDMELVKPWRWARSLSDEHRALLWIQGYKGGAFEVEYGVSCSWVPHRVGRTWRWHRTLKQARPDLWVDHFTVDAPPNPTISHLRGLDYVRRTAEVARESLGSLARSWWMSVDSATRVLAEARRQEGQRGVTHWPAPELVTVFTLAKLGDIEAARQRLDGLTVLEDADRVSLAQMLSTLP